MQDKKEDSPIDNESYQFLKNDYVEVLIVEKEIKSESVHKDLITGAQNLND